MRITDRMHKDYNGRYYRYVYIDGRYHIEYMSKAEVKAERARDWNIRNHHADRNDIVGYTSYERVYGTDKADGIMNISMDSIIDAYNDYKASMEW